MNVLVTGSSGMIGSALVGFLAERGHAVRRLVRSAPGKSDSLWDPRAGQIDTAGLGEMDAVVHLAGENIAGGRWTRARMARIAESRAKGTRALATALADLPRKPRVLVSASAVGYYGDRGDQRLEESDAAGEGFLAGVVRDWEAATAPAGEAGIRVVCLRFGVVLSRAGGALRRMLRPFRWCLGGVIGSGRQYWSWVTLDDAVRIVLHGMEHDSIAGPVNAVSPNPVTNREFTRTLGRVLRRPTVMRMPAFAARLAFGKMANDLLLASTRVVPNVLTETGYSFQYPQLEGALRSILGR